MLGFFLQEKDPKTITVSTTKNLNNDAMISSNILSDLLNKVRACWKTQKGPITVVCRCVIKIWKVCCISFCLKCYSYVGRNSYYNIFGNFKLIKHYCMLVVRFHNVLKLIHVRHIKDCKIHILFTTLLKTIYHLLQGE